MGDNVGFRGSFSTSTRVSRLAESALFGERDLRAFELEPSAAPPLFLLFDLLSPLRLFEEPLDEERLEFDLLDELELDLELAELPELELFYRKIELFENFSRVSFKCLLKKLETYSELLLLVDLGIFETISCRVLLKISTKNKRKENHIE